MFHDNPDRELDYDVYEEQVIKSIKDLGWISFATSLDNDVRCFNPKVVCDGLKIYVFLPKNWIHVQQVLKNPNVCCTITDKHIKGIGRVWDDPFMPRHQRAVELYKGRHRDFVEMIKNFPGFVVIEVEITHVCLAHTTKESTLDWKIINLDIRNRKAFWTTFWEESYISYSYPDSEDAGTIPKLR